MRVCFIHQNLPAQFGHLIKALCDDSANDVWGIVDGRAVARARRVHARLNLLPYSVPTPATTDGGVHPYLADIDQQVRRGQVVARVLLRLQAMGRVPDLIVAHPGWGETLFVKDIFPSAKLLSYCEFFYSPTGADVGFDPEFPSSRDRELRLRMRNSVFLSALNDCDAGFAPTLWQKSRFPKEFQAKISLVHEGVDTRAIVPDDAATFAIDGHVFRRGDPVITYVARNLEPYRGFHVFMRLLPQLLERHPAAHVVVVGADGISYSGRRVDGRSWREVLLDEVGATLDLGRVHFAGRLPYARYLEVLQVSAAHVYMTVPFVLSWSMIEAMAAGCLVVGSRTAPVQEVLEDGRNGLLVDFFDSDGWLNAIGVALAGGREAEAIRLAARQTAVDRFDLASTCLPRLLELVRSIVAT
jgi:glycosyltransferase involved in cell wall biosynthesis